MIRQLFSEHILGNESPALRKKPDSSLERGGRRGLRQEEPALRGDACSMMSRQLGPRVRTPIRDGRWRCEIKAEQALRARTRRAGPSPANRLAKGTWQWELERSLHPPNLLHPPLLQKTSEALGLGGGISRGKLFP